MSERALSVNGAILTWAREIAGLTLEDVASAMDKSVEAIRTWESGTAWPTYTQLETLAESLYHRPVALFFFPAPPVEVSPQEEFRTLPDFDVAHLSADTRYGLRIGRAYQQSLGELTNGANPAQRQIVRDLNPSTSQDVTVVAQQVRTFLGVDLAEQMSWPNAETAMANWRKHVEAVGVYVFKRSFKQSEVSGFCLSDDVFPIIFINNTTSFTRQVFTLFHELVHLLYGVNGITTEESGLLGRMSGEARSTEVLCNRVASEVLMPIESFPWSDFRPDDVDRSIASIAGRYKVSREAVLRRFLDRSLVSRELYRDRAAQWASDTRRGGVNTGGGDYYATQTAYLGRGYLDLAFSRYRAGLIDIADLARHLGVRAKYVGKLEERFYGRS